MTNKTVANQSENKGTIKDPIVLALLAGAALAGAVIIKVALGPINPKH